MLSEGPVLSKPGDVADLVPRLGPRKKAGFQAAASAGVRKPDCLTIRLWRRTLRTLWGRFDVLPRIGIHVDVQRGTLKHAAPGR